MSRCWSRDDVVGVVSSSLRFSDWRTEFYRLHEWEERRVVPRRESGPGASQSPHRDTKDITIIYAGVHSTGQSLELIYNL